MGRSQKLTVRYSEEGINPIWRWTELAPAWKVITNFIFIQFCRYCPSLRIKNFIYRRLGLKIGNRVSFGLMSMIDIFFPEQIEVGDNSVIGYNSTILGHEFLCTSWRTGKVKIGKNVMIGANCTILPGVTIGDGSQISACSLVNKDIPPHVLAGGVPIKILKNLEENKG
jgi:acetyltransferase-like isoleucine patch superfamily enzyme